MIEEAVEVIDEVMVPVEREVQRTIEIPVYNEVEVYEDVEIEVPVERFQDVEVVHDRTETVDIIRENVVENRREVAIDKLVELTKRVDKPQFN